MLETQDFERALIEKPVPTFSERALLTEFVARTLSARLECGAKRPLAVAVSGGGDSLALLLLAKTWADRAGRFLVAFTVDHRLQAQSGEWASWCAARAARLGVSHEILVWDGDKPARGLPAAARIARHRLIAEAARKAGASVVLFGHTADDVLEARLMRAEGVRISEPTGWSPSPAWPEGREIFIARPLLRARRATIRAWLAEQGEMWIEDPANDNARDPRARVRRAAADLPFEMAPWPGDGDRGSCPFKLGPAGDIAFELHAWRRAPDPRRLLGVAVACAAGNERPPRREALERLIKRFASADSVSTTLGGARVVQRGDQLIFARETGDGRGRACRSLTLDAGERQVWDGRFEVRAHAPHLTLTTLRGHAANLDARQRTSISALHPAARAALPTLIEAGDAVVCPTLADDPRVEIRNLVGGRLLGAIGAIDREAKIGL